MESDRSGFNGNSGSSSTSTFGITSSSPRSSPPPKGGGGSLKGKSPSANEREPWHEETLVYSLLYGQEEHNHYRTSVRPIDMATSLIKLTDNDFLDKNDFITKQCNAYESFNDPKHGSHHNDDTFKICNGRKCQYKKCEDYLDLKLRRVSINDEVENLEMR